LEGLFALKDTGNDCIDVLSTAGLFMWGDTVALPLMGEASGLKPLVGVESGGAAWGPIASADCDGAVDGAAKKMGREVKGPAGTLEELASGLTVGEEGDLPAELFVEPAATAAVKSISRKLYCANSWLLTCDAKLVSCKNAAMQAT